MVLSKINRVFECDIVTVNYSYDFIILENKQDFEKDITSCIIYEISTRNKI